MSAFETLIREKKCPCRWYPVSIESLRQNLLLDTEAGNARQSINNICYSLQYLQYLLLQLQELRLSSVLTSMVCKNIVTITVSITEAILENLLMSAGYLKLDKSRSHRLAEMIKMLKRHPEVLPVSREEIRQIDSLRILRNKIHLHNAEGKLDHDYFNFSIESAVNACSALQAVLCAPQVSRSRECYFFLERPFG